MRAFSSCGEQGLLSSWGARASHCRGFSYVEYRVLKLESSSSSQKLEKARAQQQRPSAVTKINK